MRLKRPALGRHPGRHPQDHPGGVPLLRNGIGEKAADCSHLPCTPQDSIGHTARTGGYIGLTWATAPANICH